MRKFLKNTQNTTGSISSKSFIKQKKELSNHSYKAIKKTENNYPAHKFAQHIFQNALLTDLMVKGSFILFNFGLLVQETQNAIQIAYEEKEKKSEK